jgi:hypothetical protein
MKKEIKPITAEEFDRRFDNGESVLKYCSETKDDGFSRYYESEKKEENKPKKSASRLIAALKKILQK